MTIELVHVLQTRAIFFDVCENLSGKSILQVLLEYVPDKRQMFRFLFTTDKHNRNDSQAFFKLSKRSKN